MLTVVEPGIQIPEIWESEEEKELPLFALKKNYLAFARSRFIHSPPVTVQNRATNWVVEISNRVINEWWGKARTRERVLAIKLLDIMIETAKYVKTVDDYKKTPGIENVSYFENFSKINGSLFTVTITVKKMLYTDRRYVYYYSAVKNA